MTLAATNYESMPEATAHPETLVNQIADQVSFALCYSLKHQDVDGLDISTWGGRWSGFSIDDEDYTLTDDADNYLVVLRADGVLSISTSTTNWNSTSTYARVYKITTLDGVITAIEDHRGGAGGVHGTAEATTFIAPRVASTASSTTPTPNADTTDVYILTALTDNATFGAPTGSPVQGQALVIRIKDDSAGPYTLAFNAAYREIGVTLPSTTVSDKTIYIGAIYNSTDSSWDVLGVREEE